MTKIEVHKNDLRKIVKECPRFSQICRQHNLRSPWAGGGPLHEDYDDVRERASELLLDLKRGYVSTFEFLKRSKEILQKYRSLERTVAIVLKDIESSSIPIKTLQSPNGQLQLKIVRGGRRPGAGRKPLGISKSISVTLPQEEWDEIRKQFETGNFESYSEYFRECHIFYKSKKTD